MLILSECRVGMEVECVDNSGLQFFQCGLAKGHRYVIREIREPWIVLAGLENLGGLLPCRFDFATGTEAEGLINHVTDNILPNVPADRESPITIADLEAKIMRMRDEMKGGKVVAAIDAIHAGRRRMLQWPDFSS